MPQGPDDTYNPEGDGSPPPPDLEGDPGSGWSTTTVWLVQKRLGTDPGENWTTVKSLSGRDQAGTLKAYDTLWKDAYYDYRLIRSDLTAVIAETGHTKEKDPAGDGDGTGSGSGPGFGFDTSSLSELFHTLMPVIVLGAVGVICYVLVAGIPKEIGLRPGDMGPVAEAVLPPGGA